MNRLIVVRHGIAVAQGTPGLEDDERPLTQKGEKRIRQIAKRLKTLQISPERIISSPLPRAWRTAELIADELGRSRRLEKSDSLRPETTPAMQIWLTIFASWP